MINPFGWNDSCYYWRRKTPFLKNNQVPNKIWKILRYVHSVNIPLFTQCYEDEVEVGCLLTHTSVGKMKFKMAFQIIFLAGLTKSSTPFRGAKAIAHCYISSNVKVFSSANHRHWDYPRDQGTVHWLRNTDLIASASRYTEKRRTAPFLKPSTPHNKQNVLLAQKWTQHCSVSIRRDKQLSLPIRLQLGL